MEAFVEQIRRNMPSTNKWWMFEPSFAAVGADVFHGLLSQALCRALARDGESADSGSSDADDWRKSIR
eukprot:12913674-Prorocentrum_lima.AAC.1